MNTKQTKSPTQPNLPSARKTSRARKTGNNSAVKRAEALEKMRQETILDVRKEIEQVLNKYNARLYAQVVVFGSNGRTEIPAQITIVLNS